MKIKVLASIVSAPVLALSLMSASAAAAPQARARTFASCRAEGDYAICIASGTAKRPLTIRVHVSTSPSQRVDVYWDMVCSKGLGAGGKQGHFSARAPISRVIPHPYRRPDSCTVATSAQLARNGRLHVWLTATRW